MRRFAWSMCKRLPHALCLLALGGTWGSCAFGQEKSNLLPSAGALETTVPAGPLDLEACIQLGFENQPSLRAARASLAAAQTGSNGLNKLIIPRLFTPDLGIRRQQACQGVAIAEAGLWQAEWETRYAVTRNFFTIQYVRMQQKVVENTLRSLAKAHTITKGFIDSGNVDARVTDLDLKAIELQIALVKSKKATADNGLLRAYAALREAIGVGCDYQLTIYETGLPPIAYQFDKTELIAQAIANRGEMVQAEAANRVTALEIEAQRRNRGYKAFTFAIGSDIHAKQIPQGIFNNEYRPGAIGIEMPSMLVGQKQDRMARAIDFNDRAGAVVDKTHNLVSLDVEAQYLKWQEAVDQIRTFEGAIKTSEILTDQVMQKGVKDFTGTAAIQANTFKVTIQTSYNESLYMHALALAGLERATAGAFQIYPIAGKK